jgi:hypothetical protein
VLQWLHRENFRNDKLKRKSRRLENTAIYIDLSTAKLSQKALTEHAAEQKQRNKPAITADNH